MIMIGIFAVRKTTLNVYSLFVRKRRAKAEVNWRDTSYRILGRSPHPEAE